MIQKTSLEQGIRPKEGFHRILVGTDFSPHSRAALAQALWLARKTGASITLVHTLPDLRQVVHSASYRAKLDLLYGEGDGSVTSNTC
jgi:universal stress protein E